MGEMSAGYYRYWGKASEDGRYHLLPYLYLDDAASDNDQAFG
jgi:hypothetical protein